MLIKFDKLCMLEILSVDLVCDSATEQSWYLDGLIVFCSCLKLAEILKSIFYFRSDDDDDDYEIPDSEINKILIVTQTPPAFRKHPGGDRTGDHTPRSKITAEMTKLINDGLYYYEQDLWDDSDLMVGIAPRKPGKNLQVWISFFYMVVVCSGVYPVW